MNALTASLLGLSLLTVTATGCASSAQVDDASASEDAVTADPAAAVVPQAAIDAGIVLNESIGGIAIGMTRDDVSGLLGRPMKNEYDAIEKWKEWDYRGLTVNFRKTDDGDWHVMRIETDSGKIRTKEGFGVGSYVNRLEAAYPNIKCGGGGGWQGCWQVPQPGQTETTLEHGDDGLIYSATMEVLP